MAALSPLTKGEEVRESPVVVGEEAEAEVEIMVTAITTKITATGATKDRQLRMVHMAPTIEGLHPLETSMLTSIAIVNPTTKLDPMGPHSLTMTVPHVVLNQNMACHLDHQSLRTAIATDLKTLLPIETMGGALLPDNVFQQMVHRAASIAAADHLTIVIRISLHTLMPTQYLERLRSRTAAGMIDHHMVTLGGKVPRLITMSQYATRRPAQALIEIEDVYAKLTKVRHLLAFTIAVHEAEVLCANTREIVSTIEIEA